MAESVDIAFVSDLRRAKETASYILNYHQHVEVIFTSCLRERSFGVFEGKPLCAFENALLHSKRDIFSFRPPQGESLQDLSHRVVSFYMKLLHEQLSQNVLIVGHRDWLTMLYLHLRKLKMSHENYVEYMPNNTGVSKIHITPDKATFPLFNCVRHL